MKKLIIGLVCGGLAFGTTTLAASPQEDLKALRSYMQANFPNVSDEDFSNGAYGLNANKRMNWVAMEEFPPYEDLTNKGEEIWKKPFKNGKSFASCFGDDPSKVRVKYPHWDSKTQKVVTLEGDINKCLADNGEKTLAWGKGDIAYLSAFFAREARGQKINVEVPDEPAALAAYEAGKHHFYAKRGQLNLSCADCHVYQAGKFLRGNVLSPAIGQTTHFPVWRAKWERASKQGDGFGTLHRRYGGCNAQVRAAPFQSQGDEYRNLEFFHQYMSNGLVINGPGYRE
jgi:sulfur-oxidizing protein SoxA